HLFLRITSRPPLVQCSPARTGIDRFSTLARRAATPNRWAPNHLPRQPTLDRCLRLTSHPRSFDLLTGIDSLSIQRSARIRLAAARSGVVYKQVFSQWAAMG